MNFNSVEFGEPDCTTRKEDLNEWVKRVFKFYSGSLGKGVVGAFGSGVAANLYFSKKIPL